MAIIRGCFEALETLLFDDLVYRTGGQQHVIMLALHDIQLYSFPQAHSKTRMPHDVALR